MTAVVVPTSTNTGLTQAELAANTDTTKYRDDAAEAVPQGQSELTGRLLSRVATGAQATATARMVRHDGDPCEGPLTEGRSASAMRSAPCAMTRDVFAISRFEPARIP